MTAEQRRAPRGDDGYGIRPYEPADRAAVLSLYDRVFGGDGEARFRWKYDDNPYVDDVPAMVATREGEIVAATACFAVDVRIGESRLLAFKPADPMVHPDHRGSGLAERVRQRLVGRYEDGPPDLFFDYPGGPPGARDGWTVVGELPTFYRVQRPGVLAGEDAGAGTRAALAAGSPLARAYLGARDALTSVPDEFSVERDDGVATQALLDAYRIERPGGLHALRDSRYYAWRFDSPAWDYETYAARVDDDVVAAAVIGTRETDGDRQVSITEAVPLAGNERRRRVFGALLDQIVRHHRDAALLSISGEALPRDLLASRGFLADDRGPLAGLTDTTRLIVRPASDDAEAVIDRYDLDSASKWSFSYCEQDTR